MRWRPTRGGPRRVRAVPEEPLADKGLDAADLRGRDERRERRLDDPAHLGGRRRQDGRPHGHRHHRRQPEAADRDPDRVERAQDLDLAAADVQPDLLGRLAQRSRGDVGVMRLGSSAREADLAAVVPAADDPLGQDDRGGAIRAVARHEQDEHAGGRGPQFGPAARSDAAALKGSSASAPRADAGNGSGMLRRRSTASASRIGR